MWVKGAVVFVQLDSKYLFVLVLVIGVLEDGSGGVSCSVTSPCGPWWSDDPLLGMIGYQPAGCIEWLVSGGVGGRWLLCQTCLVVGTLGSPGEP